MDEQLFDEEVRKLAGRDRRQIVGGLVAAAGVLLVRGAGFPRAVSAAPVPARCPRPGGRCGGTLGKCCGKAVCRGLVCTCPSKRPDACNGKCVNRKNDPKNCGGCGRSCINGQRCAKGQCAWGS